MKGFVSGLLKYLIAFGVIGGAVFFALKSGNSVDMIIMEDVVKVACAADYPGGCLRRGGDHFFGQEIDILEKIIYKNDRIKFDFVNADNIKNDIKSGLHDIGCGGWVYRSDGSIYSFPIIKGIKICDIVKGNWTKEDPVFVQTSTVCSEEAEDKYGSRCLKKYDDLYDCIQAYKNYMGPKRIIMDSINFEYIQENDSLPFDSSTEHGDYGICLLCKDEQTKKDLDRRISAAMNSINNLNIKNKPRTSDVANQRPPVVRSSSGRQVIPQKNNNMVNNTAMIPGIQQQSQMAQQPQQQMAQQPQQQMIQQPQQQMAQQPQQQMMPQQMVQQPQMAQPMMQQPLVVQPVVQPAQQQPIDVAEVIKAAVQAAQNSAPQTASVKSDKPPVSKPAQVSKVDKSPTSKPAQSPAKPAQSPGQVPAKQGQSPMKPGQVPTKPGQAPGQFPMKPGQVPAKPGQSPIAKPDLKIGTQKKNDVPRVPRPGVK